MAQEIHPLKNRPASVLQVAEAAGDAVEAVVRVVCALKIAKKWLYYSIGYKECHLLLYFCTKCQLMLYFVPPGWAERQQTVPTYALFRATFCLTPQVGIFFARSCRFSPSGLTAFAGGLPAQFAEGAGFTRAQARRRILELARLLPAAARKLGSDPGRGFARNAVVERIATLIEQRCALTIRRLTDPSTEHDADAEPSV